jgi:hypothetical protein
MITLTREHAAYADSWRAYQVVIDGITRGQVRRGESWSTDELAHGAHSLRVGIDWAGSQTLNFVYQGGFLQFECGSNLKGWRIILGFVYLFSPTSWCWLRQKINLAEQAVAPNRSLPPSQKSMSPVRGSAD